MISFLTGALRSIEDNFVVVETAGIGWGVAVADTSSLVIGQKVELYIHMQWSAENGPSLYGFLRAEERQLFIMIVGCSGMGPKVALSLLGNLTFSTCLKALAANDIATLSSVSGVGPKKAESLALQLKDKVAKLLQSGAFVCHDDGVQHMRKVHDVLVSLNYSRQEVQTALEHLKKQELATQATFDELMRKALGFLAKRLS